MANSMAETSPLVRGVFRQVDGTAHAQGQDEDERRYDDVNGVEYRRQDTLNVFYDALLAREELPAQMRYAAVEYVADKKTSSAQMRTAEV